MDIIEIRGGQHREFLRLYLAIQVAGSLLTGVAPQWNFHKYVIARDGQAVLSFASQTDPADRTFVQQIEKLLDAKM